MMTIAQQHPFNLGASITVEENFDFLSTEYKSLFAASSATAFQAPIWMDSVHKNLVPHLKARQHTLVVRHQTDQSLLAVFPFIVQQMTGLATLQPADFGVCDYNAVVASDETLELMATDKILRQKLNDLIRVAGLLLFRKVRADGFDVSRLFDKAEAKQAENGAYHCELGGDFQTWRLQKSLSKLTKELGRKERQLAKDHGPITYEKCDTPESIMATLEFIKNIRAGRFEEDLLDNPIYFNFYRDYVVASVETGEARLYRLQAHGKTIAAFLGLTGDGKFHGVLLAADIFDFTQYSLGNQILYRTIKQLFAEGQDYFDLGLGNSGYKSHFRAQETVLHNVTVSNSIRGTGIAFIYHNARPLKNALKKYVPYVH